ncbi:MAG: Ig-like domain-containing protein, partial [Bacteroidota bacterium]|nr:Ig-like domain-containing protein [Bacteroidota bacterium]
ILIVILSFLAATNVAAQDAFVFFEGSQKTYQVNNHAGSSYNWAVYTQVNPLVAANASATTITGNGSAQITIQWNEAGDYYLLVTENDVTGCTNTKAIRITVLPNNSKVLFTSVTSSACFQASNDFTIPIQFKDGNDLPLSAAHFPIVVSFQLNGVNQPTQTITFANQGLAISGSAFTVNPNSDTPVTITITGATDNLNLNLQPETTSGQNIHTRTIFRQLTTPTVAALTTNDTTPAISGTATVGTNETFTVSVNGFTYLPGDGNLILSGTNWTLQIPAARALPEGTFEILATVANANCSLSDATTNELVIDTTNPTPLPTVVAQTTASTTPLITGTATLASGEILTVTVNGVIYTIGDGHLSISGTVWSLQIPIANKLTVGVYQVIAKVADTAGNSSTDATTNELTIGASTITDRLATNDVNITFKNRAVSGNVLINDAGFYGFNPTVGTIAELMPVNGTLSISPNGQYTYTPNNGFTGADNFYYSVCTLEDPTDCDTVKVTIRVLEDNLALIGPVAINDEVQAPINTTVSGNVLANDLFPSGDQLVLNPKLNREPQHGKVVLERDGRFSYTPEIGFTGQDNFIYEICGNILGLC